MDLSDVKKDLAIISDKVDKIAEAIIGDPSDNNKPGLNIRVDRLERSNAALKKVIAILSGSLLSLSIFIIGNAIVKYWL